MSVKMYAQVLSTSYPAGNYSSIMSDTRSAISNPEYQYTYTPRSGTDRGTSAKDFLTAMGADRDSIFGGITASSEDGFEKYMQMPSYSMFMGGEEGQSSLDRSKNLMEAVRIANESQATDRNTMVSDLMDLVNNKTMEGRSNIFSDNYSSGPSSFEVDDIPFEGPMTDDQYSTYLLTGQTPGTVLSFGTANNSMLNPADPEIQKLKFKKLRNTDDAALQSEDEMLANYQDFLGGTNKFTMDHYNRALNTGKQDEGDVEDFLRDFISIGGKAGRKVQNKFPDLFTYEASN